jgi:hypothetical protein
VREAELRDAERIAQRLPLRGDGDHDEQKGSDEDTDEDGESEAACRGWRVVAGAGSGGRAAGFPGGGAMLGDAPRDVGVGDGSVLLIADAGRRTSGREDSARRARSGLVCGFGIGHHRDLSYHPRKAIASWGD